MKGNQIFSDTLLSLKRTQGDRYADELINNYFTDNTKKQVLRNWLNQLNQNTDLLTIPTEFKDYIFIAKANKLPVWAKPKQMELGAAFFARNNDLIMNLLALLSLPYCYAAADGALVLSQTNRMRNDVGVRLYETAEFVWEVMAPNAFTNKGKAFASILKVRLMHAAARHYILKSDGWNLALGYPVNQEDMAGTNLSFSLMVIRGLRKFGISVSYEEQLAFMHLWNVIGYLLGLEEDLLPNSGKDAFNLEEAIRVRQFKASNHGMDLTSSLLKYFTNINSNSGLSNQEIPQLMRYLLGNEVADILGLPNEQYPANKVRLMRNINLIKHLTIFDKPEPAYQKGFRKFEKEKAK